MSDPQRVGQRLSRVLAADERTGELGVTVAVVGGEVFLRGTVTSQRQRAHLTEVAEEFVSGIPVRNEVRVVVSGRPRTEEGPVGIRVAAVGDTHLGTDERGTIRPALDHLDEQADLLLLAGDLTNFGTLEEARVVAGEFQGLPVPVVGVLGNHDHHGDRPEEIANVLRGAGITVLEGQTTVITTHGVRLGVAGAKGFGGGFTGARGHAFGERAMKEFVEHSREAAGALEHALHSLDTDYRIALTHYSPTPETLRGEPKEIYPFLGSHHLADAIDAGRVDLVVHGHAHYGSEHGSTPGGVPVRNVAEPVVGTAFVVYGLGGGSSRCSEVVA